MVTFRGSVLSVTCLSVVLATTAGCYRLSRSAMRTSRPSQQQQAPEEIRIEIAELDATSVKLLNTHRVRWNELCNKYGATGLSGAAQIGAVINGINSAHWSEKPQIEDLCYPVGTAIGDALHAQGDVKWRLAERQVVCLVSANGKVAVAPVSIAFDWLTDKKEGFMPLMRHVAKAVNETKGEPVLIGFEEPVPEERFIP